MTYHTSGLSLDLPKLGWNMKLSLGLLSAIFLLSACTEGFVKFPVTESAQKSLSQDINIIRLDATNIASFSSPRHVAGATNLPGGRGWEYRVGVGDVLNIIIFDHPELTLPAGPQRSAEESGLLVQADGSFFYPYIGQVKARGQSIATIRDEVATRLAAFIPDPQVDVRIAAFNSQSVVVSGQVESSGKHALTTTPLTLVEAINASGGLKETADARRVTVQRDGGIYNVDYEGFLASGLSKNNPVLRSGDIVTVPRRKAEEAFILGQVKKPAAVDLSVEPVTLTQALTRQGGLDEQRADARGVFVFRATGSQMTVFQLETSSPMGFLLGTQFVLQPRDVVYITRSPLQRWNDTISGLLPSVQGVAAVDAVGN
jgi:polysaccharide export outer membrane protein